VLTLRLVGSRRPGSLLNVFLVILVINCDIVGRLVYLSDIARVLIDQSWLIGLVHECVLVLLLLHNHILEPFHFFLEIFDVGSLSLAFLLLSISCSRGLLFAVFRVLRGLPR
jgi:hypothetical protein